MRRAAVVTTLVGLLVGLLVAGCGTDRGDSVSTPDDTATSAAPASELTVTVREMETATPKSWTLTCDPPGGSHPDPEAACAAIAAAKDPFKPKPKDAVCTQIYGGPQTATITGTWKGEPVDASYSRTDGCEIARWKQLAPVFQVNTGIVPD